MADRNGSTMRGDRVEGKDELAETTGLRIESAWRNSHGSRQEAQRRQAHRSHIPIPTNRNRHADRRTQSLYPCGETKHNQDPLTNRGMGDQSIAAPCTKAAHSHTRIEAGTGIIGLALEPVANGTRVRTNCSCSPDDHFTARPRWSCAPRPDRVPDSTLPQREETKPQVPAPPTGDPSDRDAT